MLIARIGVGAGETTSGAPVHSLISDYFPPSHRATALAIYTSGAQFGAMLGITAGGWLETQFDWRTAFVVLGLPGLLLAVLVRTTIREPSRGRFDPPRETTPPSTRETLRYLVHRPTFLLVTFGFSMCIFASVGAAAWQPTLLRRVHGMSGAEVGFWLGVVAGGSAMIGGILTAALSDRLGSRDARWYLRLPAINTLLSVPLTIAIPFWPEGREAVWFLPAWSILTGSIAGPIYAMVQNVARPEMRATAAALNLFLMTLIGMGLGPTFVGIASDALSTSYADDSIRHALAALAPAQVIGALLWLGATRTLRDDLDHDTH